MTTNLPVHISDEEFLVRFIMRNHLKSRQKPFKDKKELNDGELFTNSKGVSLQREEYCDREESIRRAKKISEPNEYLGLAVFSKKDFNNSVKEILIDNPNFEADILATPLDENDKLIIVMGEILSGSGNFSHADLFVHRPDPKPNEQPNTVRRKFSRKVFLQSIIYFPEE